MGVEGTCMDYVFMHKAEYIVVASLSVLGALSASILVSLSLCVPLARKRLWTYPVNYFMILFMNILCWQLSVTIFLFVKTFTTDQTANTWVCCRVLPSFALYFAVTTAVFFMITTTIYVDFMRKPLRVGGHKVLRKKLVILGVLFVGLLVTALSVSNYYSSANNQCALEDMGLVERSHSDFAKVVCILAVLYSVGLLLYWVAGSRFGASVYRTKKLTVSIKYHFYFTVLFLFWVLSHIVSSALSGCDTNLCVWGRAISNVVYTSYAFVVTLGFLMFPGVSRPLRKAVAGKRSRSLDVAVAPHYEVIPGNLSEPLMGPPERVSNQVRAIRVSMLSENSVATQATGTSDMSTTSTNRQRFWSRQRALSDAWNHGTVKEVRARILENFLVGVLCCLDGEKCMYPGAAIVENRYHYTSDDQRKSQSVTYTVENCFSKHCIVSYAPDEFARMRHSMTMDDREIREGLLTSALNLTPSALKGGSSGHFAFISNDRLSVFKTVEKEDVDQLLKILPEYEEFVGRKQMGSLLVRIWGLFAVRVPCMESVYFMWMDNIVPDTRIPRAVYDLKGSLVDRTKLTRSKRSRYGTELDLDFLEKNERIRIDSNDQKRLLETLRRDVNFLASSNIMDYSILLVIVPGPANADAALDQHMSWNARTRVFPSSNNDETYYVGLIDILQSWNVEKKLENFAKTWWRCGESKHKVSCISPKPYSERLLGFVRDALGEEEEEEEEYEESPDVEGFGDVIVSRLSRTSSSGPLAMQKLSTSYE